MAPGRGGAGAGPPFFFLEIRNCFEYPGSEKYVQKCHEKASLRVPGGDPPGTLRVPGGDPKTGPPREAVAFRATTRKFRSQQKHVSRNHAKIQISTFCVFLDEFSVRDIKHVHALF